MNIALYFVVFIGVVALAVFGVANFYLWLLYLLEKSSKASKKYFFYGLLSIFSAPIYTIYILDKLDYALFNKFAIFIFILSSFIGLSIFLLFVKFLFDKKIKNSFITLLMGSVVFIFFAPSTYFTISPFIIDYYGDKNRIAINTLKRCNERGDDYDCMQMARFYREGDGVEQDYLKSIKVYKKSSDVNSSYATYQLGLIYEAGEIAARNMKLATNYYKKACQLNSTKGCMKLANSYLTGTGIEQDVLKAEALYFKHCITGDEDACSYYLDIHQRESVISYTTNKEFNGKLEDDPSNWSRAFSTPLPKNIEIIKSLFKSSSGLCCTKYSFYFKIRMNAIDSHTALSELEEIDSKDIKELKGIFPKNFKLENFNNYWIYKENGVTILVHKKTNIIYLHEDGYIDGR